MRARNVSLAIAAAVVIAAAAPAAAMNCYIIVDRGNDVIYQGTTSPVDLSDAGQAERDALRARGQQLVVMDADRCPAIDRAQVGGKGGPASVDEIVAGMRSAIPFGGPVGRGEAPAEASGIQLPRITVPRDTGGGMSVGGPPSGMSIR